MNKGYLRGRKKYLFAVVLFLTTLALGMCASAQKVSLNAWFTSKGVAGDKWQKELVKAFEKKYPNIDVNFQILPFTGYYDKLTVAFAAGRGPDVFRLGASEQTIPFSKINALYPLDEFFEKSDKISLSDFPQPMLVEFQSFDGKMRGFPRDYDLRELAYRKDWIEEAGLTPPKHWEDLVTVAKKLTKDTDGDGKIDRWGFGFEGKKCWEVWLYSFTAIRQNGGRLLSEYKEGRQESLIDSPEAREAIQFLYDLAYKHKVIPPAFTTYDSEQLRRLYWMNKLAMKWTGTWFYSPHLTQNAPELIPVTGFTRAPYPKGKEPVCFLGTHSFNIWRGTKHPEESWKFVEFLGVPVKHQLQLAEIAGNLPVTWDALRDPRLPEINPAAGIFVNYVEEAVTPTKTPATWIAFVEVMESEFSAIYGQTQSIEAGIKAIDKEFTQILKQAGLTE